MKIYNSDEKKTVIAILIAIMEADGIIDPNETEFLDRIISDFEMSESEIDGMDDIDFNLVLKKFDKFSPAKKSECRQIFLDMAKCDGFADPRELKIIESLGQ